AIQSQAAFRAARQQRASGVVTMSPRATPGAPVHRSSGRRTVALLGALPMLFAASPSAAQRPTVPDSVRRDSLARLPEVRVTVTTRDEALERVPWSVGVVGERELRRGQTTTSLEEALTAIPGLYVAPRHNYAVDSRISIRGFG